MKAKERIRVLYYYTPERAKEKEMSVNSWFTLKMPAAGRAAPDQSRSQVHHLGHSPTPLLAAARALGTSSATFQDTLAGSWMGSKSLALVQGSNTGFTRRTTVMMLCCLVL